MRILILVHYFLPRWLAGTELATYHIAKGLAKLGHDIHIITSLDKGLPNEEYMDGFLIHRIKLIEGPRFLRLIFYWISILFIVKSIDPCIIHVQGLPLAPAAFCSRLLFGKRYIIWCRSSNWYKESTDSLQEKVYNIVSSKILYKLSMNYAEYVLALTRSMSTEINKYNIGNKVLVIPNGIDIDVFDSVCVRSQKFNNNFIVLWVGRFRTEKGIEYLIRAMLFLVGRIKNIRLLLIGEGPMELKLKELTKKLNLDEFIVFIGKVPNEKIPEYMLYSDVFVLPSITEGFPLVLLEAMASGLPIIASRVDGIPEIIQDGKNGFLVEPANPNAIAQSILKIYTDCQLKNEISSYNKEFAKNFSWENIAMRIDELYSSIEMAKDDAA